MLFKLYTRRSTMLCPFRSLENVLLSISVVVSSDELCAGADAGGAIQRAAKE